MTVLAEGVEGVDQEEWLTSVGCDEAQGYHFSLPMAPGDVERWLAEGGRRLAGG
jgi:EAL domain-containing protein (putative c-di-GMP-specific phosphodiesterase class I)